MIQISEQVIIATISEAFLKEEKKKKECHTANKAIMAIFERAKKDEPYELLEQH